MQKGSKVDFACHRAFIGARIPPPDTTASAAPPPPVVAPSLEFKRGLDFAALV